MAVKKRGMALVWVILIMLVLTIIGLAFLSVSVADAKQTGFQQRKIQAHYLGRSGVYAGLRMLQDKLYNNTYTDMDTLCTVLNNEASNGGTSHVISDSGSFELNFIKINANKLKIESTGTAQGALSQTDKVTMTLDITFPDTTNVATNPAEWLTAQGGSLTNPNSQKVLKHNVDTSTNFLGKMIILNGGVKSAKYPMGGTFDVASTYQASVIALKTYRDGIPCLSQDSNKLDITFDAEIIYFGDSIEARNKDIVLSASNAVLNRPDDGILQPAEPKGVGFENVDRYIAMIQHYEPSLTAGNLRTYYNDNYGSHFSTLYKYGIVCFMKKFEGITPNYYFFPSNNTVGMSIIDQNDKPSSGILGYNRLIPIASDDPIRKALDFLFSNSGNYEIKYWNNQ